MIRRIYCDICGANWKMHPEDKKEGWQGCVVRLVAKKPASHVVTVIAGQETKSSELATLLCDACGSPIADGELAHAMSMWKDDGVFDWESDYGTVIPEDAYKMAKRLGRIRA